MVAKIKKFKIIIQIISKCDIMIHNKTKVAKMKQKLKRYTKMIQSVTILLYKIKNSISICSKLEFDIKRNLSTMRNI